MIHDALFRAAARPAQRGVTSHWMPRADSAESIHAICGREVTHPSGLGRKTNPASPQSVLNEKSNDPPADQAGGGLLCYIPSTMNERDFVALARTSLTFFWSAELFQACAFSGLSKAMMIMRFGGVRS